MIKKAIHNMTVKSRILIVVSIVTVLAIATVATIRANQVSSQMNALLEERLKGNANMTFGIFDTVRTYTMWLLDATANHARWGFIDPDYDLDLQLANLFRSMNHEDDGVRMYENIAVFDAAYRLVALACPDGDRPDLGLFPEYAAERLLGPWVSPVFENPESRLLQFLFTQPVWYGDTLLGWVTVTGNTQMLAFFLRDFIQLYDSFINTADRSGTIFFSNRPEAYMGRHVNDLGVIEAFGEIPMNTVFAHNSELTGIDKIAYVTHDPYLNWTIVSFFDAHAVESTARIIVVSLLPTVSGVLFSAGFIVLLIHFSLKPLGRLADGAKEVAKGNVAVAFHTARNDEFGQVAHAFVDIVRVLNILRGNFKQAETAMVSGETDYSLSDSRLGGIYDEMLTGTANIVEHMKQAVLQTEAASKAKSDFLSKMSHEIRTPMNAIIGMAELILRENLSASAREQAVTIKQSGNHLLSIINDILDLSKVESGKLELVKGEYLFHSVVQDVISIIKMRMANPAVRFAVYMQADIPNLLFGDEVRLRQVLLNILSNALKYTKQGHFAIDIFGETRDEETYLLTFKIKDTGIGIKPEDLQSLFEEFSQFDLEKNRSVEGTGLGLAITKNLIHLMGGTIDVTSVYGEGSEFTFTLPQRYKANQQAAPRFAHLNVLLYCRNALNTEYLTRALNDLVVTYHIADDTDDATRQLADNKWDFVFAEAELAYTANDWVKANALSAKVLMLSDSYDAFYEARDGKDFSLLLTPAYVIPVINVLSGRDSEYTADDQRQPHFVAHDARVLLVDDIDINIKVGSGLLKLYGITPEVCLSGHAAIEAVKAKDFDLVLMDHMMPEMDGVEATTIIRGLGEKYAALPIVALTANAIVGAREMFLQNGFNDFLSKPIETVKLTNMLAKWIPKEKQKAPEAETEADPQAEASAQPLVIPGVDTGQGLRLSGGSRQSYLETLALFQKSGKTKLAQLRDCLASGDFPLYTTYVHALKSMFANIGAGPLADQAQQLENAGNREDAEFLTNHTEPLLTELVALMEAVDGVLPAGPAETTLDETHLKEQLALLKAALEAFDLVTADELSEALQPFTQHPETGAALEEILQDVFVSKYKQAAEKISVLL